MNNKKKLTIAGLTTAGVAVVGFGAFAYFSDKASDTVEGKVGTVDVEINNAALKHSGATGDNNGLNNINPGDNDPSNPEGNRPGTDHELSFDVTNGGNKSVITRTVITVTGKNSQQAKISGTELEKVILSEKKAAGSLGTNDADKKDTVTPLTPSRTDANQVVYVIGGTRQEDVLSGTGADAEIEKNNQTNIGTTLKKTFDVGLKKEVSPTDPLMGATITFKVEVQAMQYRNTGDNDWVTIYGENFGITAN